MKGELCFQKSFEKFNLKRVHIDRVVCLDRSSSTYLGLLGLSGRSCSSKFKRSGDTAAAAGDAGDIGDIGDIGDVTGG